MFVNSRVVCKTCFPLWPSRLFFSRRMWPIGRAICLSCRLNGPGGLWCLQWIRHSSEWRFFWFPFPFFLFGIPLSWTCSDPAVFVGNQFELFFVFFVLWGRGGYITTWVYESRYRLKHTNIYYHWFMVYLFFQFLWVPTGWGSPKVWNRDHQLQYKLVNIFKKTVDSYCC